MSPIRIALLANVETILPGVRFAPVSAEPLVAMFWLLIPTALVQLSGLSAAAPAADAQANEPATRIRCGVVSHPALACRVRHHTTETKNVGPTSRVAIGKS